MNNNNILFKTIFACFICCAMGTSLQAKTIYVDDDAKGANNGTSWTDAYTNLVAAINISASGDQIWVAKGTYQPATKAAFPIRPGANIYGGFDPKTAPDMANRNWTVNETILKGNGSRIFIAGAAINTYVDGFSLTGCSDFSGNGGVAYMKSGLHLANCHIYDNLNSGNNTINMDGGVATTDEYAPSLTNCLIENNSAKTLGGGVYIYTTGIVRDCKILNNSVSGNGGGIAIGLRGIVEGTTVSGNTATGDGGGIYAPYYGGTYSESQRVKLVSGCIINGNLANNGGGIMCDRRMTIVNCDIYSNTAKKLGAGIWMNTSTTTTAIYGPIVIKGCKIHNNTTTAGAGGGIYVK